MRQRISEVSIFSRLLGALLVATSGTTLLVASSVSFAQACDASNPWRYDGECYADKASAEFAMRNAMAADGEPLAGDWRHFFTQYAQVGNAYYYHLPPVAHLPNPAWVAEMPNGDFSTYWKTYRSPNFHTASEALSWARARAQLPTFFRDPEIVADNLIYRGAWNEANFENYEHQVYSDDYQPPAISTTDFTRDLGYGSCSHYDPGLPDAKISKYHHSLYRPDSISAPDVIYAGWNNCLVDGIWYRVGGIPVVDVHEIGSQLCQYPYDSDGSECVADDQAVIFYGPSFALETPVQSCMLSNESNPCDPADGTKTQVEWDYHSPALGGIDFARYYRSKGANKSDKDFASGWRHTYSRYLDEEPDTKSTVSFSAPANQSSFYYTAADACTSGWTELKDNVWSGDLSAATASFEGGNVCKLSQAGQTVAYFPVRSAVGFSGFTASTTVKTLSRPNGSTIRFELSGSVWINFANPALKLQQAGSDWIYTDSEGNEETYDSAGRLTAIETRSGLETTLEYGTGAVAGKLVQVTGPFGHLLEFGYDWNPPYRLRHVAGKYDPIGSQFWVVFQYDDDNLISVEDASSSERFYLYEHPTLPNHLTGIIDRNEDRYATWDYDAAGRAILSEHAGGKERVEFAYNGDDTTTLTAANGAERTYTFSTQLGERHVSSLSGDVCSTCPGGDLSDRTYDSNGFPDEVTDWNGNVTKTIRNVRGLTEILVEAKGSTEERQTTTTWHPTFPLPTEVNAPKHDIEYIYDSQGNPTSITITDGTESKVWTFSYNGHGQLLTENGPRTDVADVTTFDYYDCAEGAQCGQLESVTNALTQVTTYDTYDVDGRLTQTTDPNGLQTTFAYDGRGLLHSVTETPTTGSARVTTFTYDDAGQLSTAEMPNGLELTYTYTDAHYLESVTDDLGNSIEYDYDAMGNLKDEDIYDPGSTLARTLDYVYDLNNRLDTVSRGGFVTDLDFDDVGNLTDEEDPELAVTQHTYDALNRLKQTLDALSGYTDYTYDDHDNLLSVTVPNGATTTYEYDNLDNLTKEISPDRGTTIYTRDAAGNVITSTDARSKVTTYTYDALNRLIEIELDNSDTITYQYDTGSNAIGRLNKITDPSGETAWTYNNFGQVTGKTHKIGTISLTTTYGYDAAGRLISMTLPSGKVLTYGYNAHLPVSVTVDSTTILSGATYEPFGPANGWTWGFGPSHGRDYDLRGLPSIIDLAGEPVTLVRDAAGQVTSASLPLSGFQLANDYDLLGRLTDFSSLPAAAPLPVPDTQTFTYDANGNRESLTENGTPYSYTNATYSNRLTSLSGPVAKTYSYDAAGNVTSDGIHSYSYDDRRRLVSVNSGAATYVHNGQGQRVKKDVSGTATLFAYDEQGRLIGEYDALGNALMEHVWFDGAPVAVLKGSTVYQVDTDHLGTPRIIFEGYAGIVWTWISDPFGSTPAQEYTDGTSTLFKYNLRFPGQYYDEETGLHYNYFRTYDPSTGRYLESDPIGLAAGLNSYGYVSANPLSFSDPYGLYEGGGISEVFPGYDYHAYRELISNMDYRIQENRISIDVSVFGCIGIHCVSGNANGARHQFGMPALGGGISFCTSPQSETSCEDIDAARERSSIYPPGNGNVGLTGGRAGVSVERWPDGRYCVLFGPHVGLPGPISDGGNAMPGSYP